MPYKSKGKKDCTQSDGSKGKYQTVKKNGTKRCYKSKKQYDAAMAWAHEVDEAGYGEEINEDIARILIADFTDSILESNEIIYDRPCQYEIDINAALDAAGIGTGFSPPPNPRYCHGTDAGADAAFFAYNPVSKRREKINLELKAGGGNKEKTLDINDPVHGPAGQKILDQFVAINNVSTVKKVLVADFNKFSGNPMEKGLLITPATGYAQQDIPFDKIAAEIVATQEAQILDFKSNTTAGFNVYYYMGRTANAKKIGIDLGMDLSKRNDALVGTWQAGYADANTSYVQIENFGMYYMEKDPLGLEEKLGVSPFTGTAQTTARYRFRAGGGGTRKDGSSRATPVTEGFFTSNGNEFSYKVLSRRFLFVAREDLSMSSSPSGFNLDMSGSPQALATAVADPALGLEESAAKIFLKEALLSEGRGEQFEIHLQDAINGLGLEGVRSEVVSEPSYDMNLSIGDKTAKVEIKLSEKDQLGKVPKCAFSKLDYIVGQGFDWEVYPVGTPCDSNKSVIINPSHHELAPLSIAQVETVMPKMEAFYKAAGLAPGTVVDCRSGWETQFPDIPIPMTRGIRQFSSHGSGLRIPAALVQQVFNKVDYLIIGNNAVETSGRIGYTGGDKLGLGVAPIVFNDSSIECRWRPTAKKGEDQKTTFTFETRAVDGVPGGNAFSDLAELEKLLSTKNNLKSKLKSQFSKEFPNSSSPDQPAQNPATRSREDQARIDRERERDPYTNLRDSLKRIVGEILEEQVSDNKVKLIVEELTGADKSEIKKMIAKEIEGASNRRETQKVFQAEFEKELKKSIKNSRSIKDSIKKEVENVFKDKATKNQVGEITKAVMKKLYRELSMNTPHVIDNIKL